MLAFWFGFELGDVLHLLDWDFVAVDEGVDRCNVNFIREVVIFGVEEEFAEVWTGFHS